VHKLEQAAPLYKSDAPEDAVHDGFQLTNDNTVHNSCSFVK
jgi:hypothetical protein